MDNVIFVAMSHSVQDLLYAMASVDLAVEFASYDVFEQFAAGYSLHTHKLTFEYFTVAKKIMQKTSLTNRI